MFVTLLGAGYQFTHTTTSNGTLWLVLDQSGSMAQTDPQATPVERLRWADAAGLLPADAHASPLGRHAAKLDVLLADLSQLQAVANKPVEDKDAAHKVGEIAKGLKKWSEQVSAVADAVDKEPGKPDARTIQSLRTAADGVGKTVETVGKRQAEQAAGNVPWRDASTVLSVAATSLRAAADTADAALAKTPPVQDGLSKVARLDRADIAKAILTKADPSKKGSGNSGTGTRRGLRRLAVAATGEDPRVRRPVAGRPA